MVSAPSLCAFKGSVDKYWGNWQFSLDPQTFYDDDVDEIVYFNVCWKIRSLV